MPRRRANDLAFRFALSTMLSTSLFAHVPDAVASSTAEAQLTNAAHANSPTSPISDAQFQKIIVLIDGPHGIIGDLESVIAEAFGMAEDRSVLHVRSISFRDQDVKYGITHFKNKKGYMLSWKNGDVVRYFLMDEHRSLISGLIVEKHLAPAVMPVKDTTTIFPQVLAFWASRADALPPNSVSSKE